MDATLETNVVTVLASASLRAAALRMRDEQVGSLVVVDEEGLAVGIVTDRDLAVRGVAWERDPESTSVDSVMSQPLRALDADQIDFESALQQMREGGHRRLPVCVGGKPIGMITFDDLLDTMGSWLADLVAIQAPRLREVSSRRETSKLLEEIHHGVEKARELGWKTRETIFHDLDSLEARVKRALETMF